MSTRVVRLLTFLLVLSFCSWLPASAQVTVNYGARVSSAAKPIPAGAIAAQLGFLQSSGGLGLLHLAGFRQMRLDAQLSNVFNTPNPPSSNWSILDDVLKVVQQQGLQVMIVIDYTPGWLQQTPNPCPAGTASYHSPPTDIGAWAGLAGQVVDHMNTNFPGLVTDYEIWNEPDLPNGLCTPDETTRLNTYLAMYAAAATEMRRRAAGNPIRIGGPAVVNDPSVWIQALLTNASTSGLVDFVSYHKYLGYTELIQAGLTWDGANGTPAMRDLIPNFGSSYAQIAGIVRQGSQPNPSATPIYITEYNDDAAFMQDCCRNDPRYSPLFNVMTVASLMNTVYAGAQGVPSRLFYFSASTSSGFFCLVGVLDANLDCSTTGGPLQPYPQYYAYQLLASPNFLNMAAGGNMAVSATLPGNLQGFAFYTAAGDGLVLANPASTDVTGVSLALQNPGTVSSNAVQYLLNAANEPMTSSTLPLTPSGNTLTGTLTVPALSVVALSLSASSSGVVVSISPTSATLTTAGTQQFTGSATGSNSAVTWSVDGIVGGNASVGAVSASGLYTAPSAPGTHTVTATSVADPSQSAGAVVTVQSSVVVGITPASATLATGQQQAFTANVSNAANTQVTWSVDNIPNGNAASGTISSAGVYTAPADAGQHVVTATSVQAPTASASAQVSVTAAADFTLAPQSSASATVVAGQSATFLVNVAAVSGFSGNVQFSCSGAPPGGTCSPSPAAANLVGGTITVAYIVSTTARTSSASVIGSSPPWWTGALALLWFLILMGARRHRGLRIAGLLALMLLVSCGGGGGGGGNTPPPTATGTPAGSYNLTLTATSGSLTHNTPAKLVVQ